MVFETIEVNLRPTYGTPGCQQVSVRVLGAKEVFFDRSYSEDHFNALFDRIWKDIGREIAGNFKNDAT